MKYSAFLLAAISLLLPTGLRGADAPQTQAQDAAVLVASKGATWQSAPIEVELKDGSKAKKVLMIEFTPAEAEKEAAVSPGARAKARLILKTEDAAPNSSATLGDGSSRDVRLEETDGARTMTITRALETVPRRDAKTPRILARNALTFTYELRDTTLTLKGFPKGPTVWGVTTFTVPEKDIVFKPLK